MDRNPQISRHSILQDSTVKDALSALNNLSGERMTLFVVDNSGKLKGTVTDGDIRRALLSGSSLDSPVTAVMNRNFIAARGKEELRDKISVARVKRLDLLPVVTEGRLSAIIDLTFVKTYLPIDAVLMAGGRGERLRPLTDTLPKPLLPVGDKPIIDHNVDILEAHGIENIYVTVNYLADLIKSHFSLREGSSAVKCVEEPKRLGTMGSLSLVEGLSHDNVLLMNSDLLAEIDFEGLYRHHLEKNADVTVAAVPYVVSVPYAIMNLEGDYMKGIEEKPTFNYLANAGVYLLRRDILARLKKGEYMDTPDFISMLIAEGGRVACYPIEGTWIDIGSPKDYRYANEIMSRKVGK